MHFEVYPDQASISDSTNAIATSQLALPEEVCNVVYAEEGDAQSVANLALLTLATDGIFGDDGATTQMATVTGDVASGYTINLSMGVDTRPKPAEAPSWAAVRAVRLPVAVRLAAGRAIPTPRARPRDRRQPCSSASWSG